MPLVGGFAVDVALDLEQGVDALHRLESDRRDLLGRLALPDVAFDIREFEELAACMAPAERGCHRSGRALLIVKLVMSGIGVSLQGALQAHQMPGGRFTMTPLYDVLTVQPSLDAGENGGAKVGHGSGGMTLLRAA